MKSRGRKRYIYIYIYIYILKDFQNHQIIDEISLALRQHYKNAISNVYLFIYMCIYLCVLILMRMWFAKYRVNIFKTNKKTYTYIYST